MSGPGGLQLTEWAPKHVITRHVRFTGFGDDGNGWDILNWLHDLHLEAYGRDEVIYYQTPEREEAVARVGFWFIEGTRGEVYAVTADVHTDKYQPVTDGGTS